MRLKRLAKEDMTALQGKALYCYEKSETYLRELQEEFPEVVGNLKGIIDENRRSQGALSFDGQRIPVEGISLLNRIDWTRAVLVITNDYYREVYEDLLNGTDTQELPETIYYYANRETSIEETYRKRYQDRPLENLLLFRSGPHASSYVKGMDYADNARALFEYMLSQHLNETYEMVWLVKNPLTFRAIEEKYENVRFLSFDWSISGVKEERDSYYRALCLAKYIFMTDAYGFARNARKDQVRVQLWHGCGFKTRVNFVRCEKRYEYTTVISELYSRIHQEIYGLRKDQMLVTGYARQDWLFHPAREVWQKLSMPKADRFLFWLPTFRTAKEGLTQLSEREPEGETGLPIVNSYEKLAQLELLLESLHMALIIKLHPFQEQSRIGEIGMKQIKVLENELLADENLSINQLLGCADALISDYSSVAVDYMLLDRPIGFTLDDLEEYRESRGFVFTNIRDWLPGKEIISFEDLCVFVREVGAGKDSTADKRRKLRGQMHQYGDAGNCRRITEALHI